MKYISTSYRRQSKNNSDAVEVKNLLASPNYSTAQHSTAQHSTAQHSTAQHSTAQHSTAQHSTVMLQYQ